MALSMFVFVLLAFLSFAVADLHRAKYESALKDINWDALRQDILQFLTNSQDFWPADFGTYGPFMIRQAWHCAGSYRTFDGRGGCDGGRQRFDPERSWDDNTNLDKAKRLLWPIKEKYGLGLSWGDLIIFTANVAIESMGGPVLGFCAGRYDDYDGSASVLLGPTPEQEANFPCPVQGKCPWPLGTNTVGLIYVNPEGPMGNPDPVGSSAQVREVFARMDMNDQETVALIGGGHAFGKCHGACPLGPGPSPKVQPSNPWPGMCGTGKGKDTFTSGFEGAWSAAPTTWGNFYFQELINNQWNVWVGPGGHHQWKPASGRNIMMLTSDISLTKDSIFQGLVQEYAANLSVLNYYFSHAWYKLTTRDMGPVARCRGPLVPPAQPWQYPLPAPLPPFDVRPVTQAIIKALFTKTNSAIPPDTLPNGTPYYGGHVVALAYQCMTTYRGTDFLGGCNGARIRFAPPVNWQINTGLADVIANVLGPVYDKFRTNITWADLIVLAGNTALEIASGRTIPFQGGRSDAIDASGWKLIQPNGNYSANFDQIRAQARLIGLTDREIVALSGRIRSPNLLTAGGFASVYKSDISKLDNSYFTALLDNTYKPFINSYNNTQYQSVNGQYFLTPSDLNLAWDASFLSVAQEFASNQQQFLDEFIGAWTKLTNLDRF